MAQDLFQYEKMVERALRGVVRDALRRAAREGLPGAHHFYIVFATRIEGVVIPNQLRARYPDEMAIVLQHQFWDLEIGEHAFSVTLSFQKQLERLVIPFAAVRSFADPSVNFALEFADPEARPAASDNLPMPLAAPPASADKAPSKLPSQAADKAPGKPGENPPEKTTAEVVALDSFRKR